jgi:uncharacterized protein (TIGR02147 family)
MRMLTSPYQDLLKEELTKRCTQNPNYSLRAFARFLEIEPAQLSRVLNGKQNISTTAASGVAERLYKSQREREYFIALVTYVTAKRASVKENALLTVRKLAPQESTVQIQLDALAVISDWYHFPMLDLTTLDGFKLTPTSAASYLGISEIEAKLAIDRLMKLGLLIEVRGQLKKSSAHIATPNGVPSRALQKFHKQMMLRAIESLEAQSVSERHNRGKTMAIARSEVPKFKHLIEDFFEQTGRLITSATAPKKKDALYQLNLQFFDLRKEKRK